jgi:hypothetical protein
VYPSYASSLACHLCRRGSGTGVANIDEGVRLPAPARVIRPVVIGAKVEDLDLAYLDLTCYQ